MKNSTTQIIDRDDYKLIITVKEFRPQEYHIKLQRFMMDSGWHTTQFFLTAEELKRFKDSLY